MKFAIHAVPARSAVLLAALCAVLGPAGCSLLHSEPQPAKDPQESVEAAATTGPRRVRFGGDGAALGEVDAAALTPHQLVDEVDRLLEAERAGSAERFVQRYPDVAWELLRSATAQQCRSDTVQFIAAAHDRQCSRGGRFGWAEVVAARAADPERHASYQGRRRRFLDHLQNGRVQEAIAEDVASVGGDPPGRALVIDGLHLSALALLVDNRPAEAAAALERAAELARDGQPYQTVRLTLLLSEARRRAGDTQAALRYWQEAAAGAAELALAEPPVADPILWERIAYLRPVETDWPAAVQGDLGRVAVSFGVGNGRQGQVLPASTAAAATAARGEMLAWTCIGHWRLGREEPQSALVALKRAEASADDSQQIARLRLAQAQALLALDQPAAARAMLVPMAADREPTISHPALAMLGTLMLRDGGTVQGYNLLRRAVEEDQSVHWPERPQAEADLGLAYLMLGDEQSGLRWLHAAQKKLEAAGDRDQLVLSLENELAYLDEQKKKSEAKQVRRRLESLEAL